MRARVCVCLCVIVIEIMILYGVLSLSLFIFCFDVIFFAANFPVSKKKGEEAGACACDRLFVLVVHGAPTFDSQKGESCATISKRRRKKKRRRGSGIELVGKRAA